MSLQKTLRNDLKQAIRNKDATKKDALRLAISEIERNGTKEIADAQVVKKLNSLINSERTTEELTGKEGIYTPYWEDYLPKQATDDEIEQWITDNINFSQYKTPMQAMKDIMTEFGGRADGNRIKEIVLSYIK